MNPFKPSKKAEDETPVESKKSGADARPRPSRVRPYRWPGEGDYSDGKSAIVARDHSGRIRTGE